VERISAWNEATRKLRAKGCYGERLLLVDEYVDSRGFSNYKYECEDNNGTWHTLRKYNEMVDGKFVERWVIHGD
jgi:hypothetical protein